MKAESPFCPSCRNWRQDMEGSIEEEVNFKDNQVSSEGLSWSLIKLQIEFGPCCQSNQGEGAGQVWMSSNFLEDMFSTDKLLVKNMGEHMFFWSIFC